MYAASPITAGLAIVAFLLTYLAARRLGFTAPLSNQPAPAVGTDVPPPPVPSIAISLIGRVIGVCVLYYVVITLLILGLGGFIPFVGLFFLDGYGALTGFLSGNPFGILASTIISETPLFIFVGTHVWFASLAVVASGIFTFTSLHRSVLPDGRRALRTIYALYLPVLLVVFFLFLAVVPVRKFYYVYAGAALQNESLCAKAAGTGGLHPYCLGKLGVSLQNPDACNSGTIGIRSQCIVQYAGATKDARACDELSVWLSEGTAEKIDHRWQNLVLYAGQCYEAAGISPEQKCDRLFAMGPVPIVYLLDYERSGLSHCALDSRSDKNSPIRAILPDEQIIALLNAGAEVNALDEWGDTLLMNILSSEENYNCKMIYYPPTDSRYRTSILEFSREELVRRLIQEYGADLEVYRKGETAKTMYKQNKPDTCTNTVLDPLLK